MSGMFGIVSFRFPHTVGRGANTFPSVAETLQLAVRATDALLTWLGLDSVSTGRKIPTSPQLANLEAPVLYIGIPPGLQRKNHPVIENVVGEQAPLCTLRIWTSQLVSALLPVNTARRSCHALKAEVPAPHTYIRTCPGRYRMARRERPGAFQPWLQRERPRPKDRERERQS